MPWRLCMSPLLGSSRNTLLTTMPTSRSVNHPLGRNHVLVATAEEGMRKIAETPTVRVIRPSIRNSLQKSIGVIFWELSVYMLTIASLPCREPLSCVEDQMRGWK